MPETLSVPTGGDDLPADYRRVKVFPDVAESRRLAHGVLRMCNPFRREPLGVLIGTIYALFALVLAAGVKDQAPNLLAAVGGRSALELLGDSISPWALILTGLLAYALHVIADIGPGNRAGARVKRWLYSLAHTAAHVVPIFVMTLFLLWALAELDLADSGFWPGYVTAALMFLFGSWWGRSVVAVYQYLANRDNPRQHMNDVFASQSIEDYKGFLRFRIGPDGELTVFPVGVQRIVKDWNEKPAAAGGAELLEPWLEPGSQAELQPELIEAPYQCP